jgi:hypothetical protein
MVELTTTFQSDAATGTLIALRDADAFDVSGSVRTFGGEFTSAAAMICGPVRVRISLAERALSISHPFLVR